MGVNLRPLDEDNAAVCLALRISDSQKNYSQITEDTPALITELVSDPLTTVLTIYNDHTMVGFVAYCPHLRTHDYEITYLLIDEKHQGLGYGTDALKQTIELLCEIVGCARIKIRYMEFNISAQSLYRRMGFVVVSIKEGYVDAILECTAYKKQTT